MAAITYIFNYMCTAA